MGPRNWLFLALLPGCGAPEFSASEMQSLPPESPFAPYLLAAAQHAASTDAGLGYSTQGGGHTRPLTYDGAVISDEKTRTSHCVGATFQFFVTALNAWFQDNRDDRVWSLPVAEMLKEPGTFKHCWYVDESFHCRDGVAEALARYGLGSRITDFSQLRPGDFVQYWRSNGTGHSVLFLGFLDGKGTVHATWPGSSAVGFRYVSSQGSTRGMGYRKGFFSGHCNEAVSGRDCGILKSSLGMARVSDPREFRQARQVETALMRAAIPRATDLEWADDAGSERLD